MQMTPKNLNLKIGVIGVGKMGSAILEGILAKGITSLSNLSVSNYKRNLVKKFEKRGVSIHRNSDIAERSDVIILAVKPNQIFNVLDEIKPDLTPAKTILSIAAGVSTKTIESRLKGLHIPVIRTMPNLLLKVNGGITAYSLGKYASNKGWIAETIFSASGKVFRIPENKMDAITAISGSGPGYIFYVAEILEKIARKKGFSNKISRMLSTHIILGSGRMLLESGEPPEVLRQSVSSPGGTTLAGLLVLRRKGLAKIFDESVKAAERRSKKMTREIYNQDSIRKTDFQLTSPKGTL